MVNPDSKKPRRRKYLIHQFQYRLLALFVFYFFLLLFVFASSLFLPLMIDMGDSGLPYHEQERAAHQAVTLLSRLWPAIVLTLVLLVMHSVLISHRIAGPLYRMRCVLRMVGAGCLTTKATFRKYDYFTNERDAINSMIDGLTERLSGIKREAIVAGALFDDLRRSMSSDMTEETRRQFADLGVLLNGINERLAEFFLPSTQPEGGPATPAAGEASRRKVGEPV